MKICIFHLPKDERFEYALYLNEPSKGHEFDSISLFLPNTRILSSNFDRDFFLLSRKTDKPER